ncbi:MAG TPA: hypothetical protein VNO17_04385 [Actinomycetota bacterium]|nr:hypothetical protein [Actinomycetota bacterium]
MRHRRLSLIGLLALLWVIASPWGASADPPGNNGTVKVDGVEFDDHPNNEPHPGCTFQIDFYGYDQGDLQAEVLFALHPPSGTGTLLTDTVDIGEDAAGGGTDLDASRTYDLSAALLASGATPHPNQGFHVKLTVHAEGSIGADVKHKVFWVECLGYPIVEPTDTELQALLFESSPEPGRAVTFGHLLAVLAGFLLVRTLVRRTVALRRRG